MLPDPRHSVLLVGYQAFRVPVEILLHRLMSEGVVPVQIIPGLVAALQENYRMYQESYGPTKGPMN